MTAPALVEAPRYGHLQRLTDATGVFEHARFDEPRPAHGYCVDDVARALLVSVRASDRTAAMRALTTTSLTFLERAIDVTGLAHNRMAIDGRWTDEPGMGDWWGRAVWATGVASVEAVGPATRRAASALFDRSARAEPAALHTAAFAALGAGAVLLAGRSTTPARRLLERFAAMLPAVVHPAWPWPEARLRYGNGSIAEAAVVAGRALHDPVVLAQGLAMLDFLLTTETRSGHLSVAGTDGRGPGDRTPLFDQQPIEIVAIADACAAAFTATGDPAWLDGVRMAWAWFGGDNDSRTPMLDPLTGAGFDGLEPTGRNLNRGAESTLAALGTWQLAYRHLRTAAA